MENKLNIIKSLGFREHNQEVALLDIINSYNELNESIGFHKKHEMSNKFNDSLGGIFGYNHLLNTLYENKDLLYKEFKLDDKFIEYVKLIMLNERFHKGDHYYDRRYKYDFLNKKADINYLSCDINYISSLSKEQILQIFKIENLNYTFIFNKYIIRFFNNLLKYNQNIDNEILSIIINHFAYEKSTIELILNHKEFNEKLLEKLANNYEAEKDALELIKDKVNKMNTKSDKEIFLEKSMAGKNYEISANGFDIIYDFFLNFKEISTSCDNKKRKEYFSKNKGRIYSNINYEEFNKFINSLDDSFFNYYEIDEVEFKSFLNTLLVNSCFSFIFNNHRAQDFIEDFAKKLNFSICINNDIQSIKQISREDIINHIYNDPVGILVFNEVYIDFINNLLTYNENIDEEVLELIIEWLALDKSTNDLIINHKSFNKYTMYDLLLDSNLPSDENDRILELKNKNLKENKMSKVITEINGYDEFIDLLDSGKHDKEELFNKINFTPDSLEELSKLYSIYKNRIFTESFDLFDLPEDIMTDFICSLPLKELDSLTPWLKLFDLESYDGDFEVFKRLSGKSKKYKQIAYEFALTHFNEYIDEIGYNFSDLSNDDEIFNLITQIANSFNDNEYKEKFIKHIIENYENSWFLFYTEEKDIKCNILFEYLYDQDYINILGEIFSTLGKIVKVNQDYSDINEEHIAEMINNLDAKDFNKLKKIDFSCIEDHYSAESIFNIYKNLSVDRKELFLNTIKNLEPDYIIEDKNLSEIAANFINFNKLNLDVIIEDTFTNKLSNIEIEFLKLINKPILDKFISSLKNKELKENILSSIQESSTDELANKKPAESLNKDMKEEKEPSKKSEAIDWYKSRLLEGTYQGIAKEAVDKAIDLIVVASGNKEGVRDFLKSEIGFALVSGAVGSALHFIPFEQLQDAKVQKIADKCVENSVSSGVSKIIDTVVTFILPAVTEASSKFRVETLDSLPDPNTKIEEDESELVKEAVGFSKSSR